MLMLGLLYTVPDWAKVAILVALIPLFFVTLSIEKLKLLAPGLNNKPDLPMSDSAIPPPG
jgi:hypothetical protein